MEKFEGVIQLSDGGGACVEVPEEVISALGGGGRIPVRATFDGIAYRGSIASMGGCKALGVLKQIRTSLGKGDGDPVLVTLIRDEEERTVDVPEDLASPDLAVLGVRGGFLTAQRPNPSPVTAKTLPRPSAGTPARPTPGP
jgi:hypothetical protein